MLDKEIYLSHLHRDEDRTLGDQVLDKIEMVLTRKSEFATDFLDPYQRTIALGIIKQITEINYREDGGYQRAERKRITIFPDFLFPDHVEKPVRIIKIAGNFNFQAVNHRDFLGAILGLGVKRKMVGDLLVHDDFAQIIVANEISQFLMLNLKRVHEVPVEVLEITEEELQVPSENTRTINATVPSMRLDAITSAGFGDSRNKISREIKAEKVKVNYKPETNPAQKVEIGDLISIRGRGRIKVVSQTGISHRGRIKLIIERYT